MKLNKVHKAIILNKLVSDTFFRRIEKLTPMEHALFNLIIKRACPAADEMIIRSLDKKFVDKFLCKTSYVNVNLPMTKNIKGVNDVQREQLEKLSQGRTHVIRAYGAPSCKVKGTLSFRLNSCKGEVHIVPFGFRESTITLDNPKSREFKAALKLQWAKYEIYRDREILIKKLEETLAGITTDKQLTEFNHEWALLLPKPEPAAKLLMASPQQVNELIKCCKEGNCGN